MTHWVSLLHLSFSQSPLIIICYQSNLSLTSTAFCPVFLLSPPNFWIYYVSLIPYISMEVMLLSSGCLKPLGCSVFSSLLSDPFCVITSWDLVSLVGSCSYLSGFMSDICFLVVKFMSCLCLMVPVLLWRGFVFCLHCFSFTFPCGVLTLICISCVPMCFPFPHRLHCI